MNYQPNMTNPFIAQQQTYQQYGAAYNQYAAPIGSVGYNANGYYNNYQMYDPLEIRKQLEQEEERRKSYYENNIAVRKRMVRCVNAYDGYDTDNDALDGFFTEENLKAIYDEEHKYDHIDRLAMLHHQQQQYRAQQQALYEQQRQQYIESAEPVKNQTLFEFLEETATDHYIDALKSQAKASASQNIGRLYNHDSFAELIHRHNNRNTDNIGTSLFNPNITVDDIEIDLPAHLKKDYDIRRAQFMQAITQNNRLAI